MDSVRSSWGAMEAPYLDGLVGLLCELIAIPSLDGEVIR